MGPVIPAIRGLLAALLVGAALLWAGSTASAADPHSGSAEVERAIFTGTFIGSPQIQPAGGARVRTYRVAVGEVFGPVDVPTQRVLVRATVALENCAATGGNQQGEQGEQGESGQPDPGSAGQEQADPPTQQDPTPDSPTTEPGNPEPTEPTGTVTPPRDRQLRLFDTVAQDGVYVVAGCDGVAIASETVLRTIEEQFGAGRPSGSSAEPEPEPEQVGYLCPDTRDAVADLDDSASCSALDDSRSFNRMAAPGLALVIVGVLGLFVARRMGRLRRPS